MTPSFSIITHVLNSKELIIECMENVRERGQECGCMFEHLIIDGGSTDGTVDVIHDYAASHPHVILVSQIDVPIARAGNEALKVAGFDLIAWLDVAERFNPDAFTLVCKFFNEEQDLKFLIGSHSKVNREGTVLSGHNSCYTNQTDLVEFWKCWGSSIVLPWRSTFYRRDVHDELGPYDDGQKYFEYEFFLRASEKYSFFCVAERLTSFLEDSDAPSSDWETGFLKASRIYWGKLGRKSVTGYSLSSAFHLKCRPLASVSNTITSLSRRLFLKLLKIRKTKAAEIHNRRFFSMALETPPIEVNPLSTVEIHSLSGKRDLYMLLLNLKSFLRYYNDVRVVIHDDGTLGPKGKAQLKHHIRGVEIFSSTSNPDEFDEHVARDFYVYKAKGIINHSKGNKIIMLDSDMLFIKEHSEILEWIGSDDKIRRYGVDHYEHHSKYIEIERASNQEDLAPCFNAGLLCLYAEDIEKHDFISLVQRLEVFDSVYFVEQVAFCFIISRYPHRSLSRERYVPCFFPDPDCGKDFITEDTAHLHFMGDKSHKVHDLYRHYANRVFEDLCVS